ncbi:MAG: Spy/CpxP family protein refolding chaperone [Syntrophales bacterium]|nr:Spy/CpxP family protein refolding chaperone [Syntrophales bacterium]
MKRKAYERAFSATIIIAVMAFLSTIIFADVNPSFAASSKKKSSTVASSSAVEQTEAHIKQLQGALKITEAQKDLWNNLTQVMRENAKDMDALIKAGAENAKTMNAVEHMKFHSQITEAHLAQLKKFIPPFEALYASMSDEQKKTADKIFQTGISGKSKRK